MKTAEFLVSDFFVPLNGKAKYTKSYIEAHEGPYPVYSASLRAVFGFTSDYDHDGHFLTWVMNGYGGRVQEVNGKFSANRDRGVLIPREDVVTPDLAYVRFALEPSLISLRVGRIVDGRLNEYTKIYPPAAEAAELTLPVLDSGKPDYALMAKIGEKLRRVEEKQASVRASREEIHDSEVSVPVSEPYRMVSLGERNLFELSIGSRILRSENAGLGIPIYSANVRIPFGFATKPNVSDFSRPSLLWGIDTEAFDWAMFEAGVEFSITDHTGRLQLLTDNLDISYLLHALRASRTRYGFDRVFRANLKNIGNEVDIPVPLNESGQLCLPRQRRLAEVHRRVEATRQNALGALDNVLDARPAAGLLASVA